MASDSGQVGARNNAAAANELLMMCNKIGTNKLLVRTYRSDATTPKRKAPIISKCKMPNNKLEIKIPPHMEVLAIMRFSSTPRNMNSSTIGAKMAIVKIVKTIYPGVFGTGNSSSMKFTNHGATGANMNNWNQNMLMEKAMDTATNANKAGSHFRMPFKDSTSQTEDWCLRK